jgi:TPR repeat protein
MPHSARNLGYSYKNGKGVLQDYKEAEKWYRLAAEQGQAASQTYLGEMYERSNDFALAHMWYNISAVNGYDDDASKNRDNIAARMTSADASMAQAMASECLASNYKNCGN